MRRWHLLALVLVTAMVAGIATAGASSAEKSLHFTLVKGKKASNVCNIATGDVLKATGSGFTPNGRYVTIAFYPINSRFHGELYYYLLNHGIGKASATGTTPHWSWDCTNGVDNRPDPVGTYRLIIVDVRTAQAWGGYIEVINK